MKNSLLGASLAISVLAGCYGVADGTMAAAGSGTTSSVTDGGLGAVATGLPCDVAQVLAARCTSCHSDPPIGGSPMGLVTYADLTAPGKSDATKSVAQLCLDRMQNTSKPMPPSPAAAEAASDVAILQAWVTAGLPMGTCGATGGTDYNTPLMCSSMTMWTRGNRGSSSMHPGGACINCHSNGGEGPDFSIAGTVFPSAHEPIDCNGSSGATVVITDAAGRVLTLTTNGAGNFSSGAALKLPYSAKVVSGGKERAMSATQMSGDCNSCHTDTGANGAPGRIMLP